MKTAREIARLLAAAQASLDCSPWADPLAFDCEVPTVVEAPLTMRDLVKLPRVVAALESVES